MIESHNMVIVNRLLSQNYFVSYSFKIACAFVLDNELSEIADTRNRNPQSFPNITDAIKERKRTLGAKQILSSMKNSKLVVISQSVPTKTAEKIEESAQNDNVPLIHFNDTSVILGKLCGLQFRVSAISLSSLSNTNVQAILKEYETK